MTMLCRTSTGSCEARASSSLTTSASTSLVGSATVGKAGVAPAAGDARAAHKEGGGFYVRWLIRPSSHKQAAFKIKRCLIGTSHICDLTKDQKCTWQTKKIDTGFAI